MSKKYFFITALFLLLVIAGCNGPGPLEIYRGTSGVEISFMDSAPQRDLYERNEVLITVEAWNKGAYSLVSQEEHAIIGLSYDPLYFRDVTPDRTTGYAQISTFLQGKSIGWPTGERTLANIAVLEVRDVPGTRETPITNIKANVCYPYRTFLTETVCMDADIYNIAHRPVCRNQPRHSYSSQGAPVVIERLDSEMLPAGTVTQSEIAGRPIADPDGWLTGIGREQQDTSLMAVQPSFTIHLRNAGRGIVLTRKEDQPVNSVCGAGSDALTMGDINGLNVNAWLGNIKLTCQPETVSMIGGRGQARCFVPRNESIVVVSNYIDTLSVEVDYFYREEISKEVRINRII